MAETIKLRGGFSEERAMTGFFALKEFLVLPRAPNIEPNDGFHSLLDTVGELGGVKNW